MTPVTAETLGLRALAWLVGQPEPLERFLRLTGTDAAQLRNQAGEPATLGAILDHLLSHEQLAMAFCTDENVQSRDLHMARYVLTGAR